MRWSPIAKRGFVLPQLLLILLLMSGHALLLWGSVMGTVSRVRRLDEGLTVRLGLLQAIADSLWSPPDLGLLCHRRPLDRSQVTEWSEANVVTEVRWRHLGRAVILAEVDVLGPTGARTRAMAWATPDSVGLTDEGLDCGGRLHSVGGVSLLTRPGE